MDGGLLRWKEFLAFSTRLCYPICGAASTTVQGRRLAPPSQEGTSCPLRREGVVLMLTYSELFQFCLVIIGIIGLFLQAKKK